MEAFRISFVSVCKRGGDIHAAVWTCLAVHGIEDLVMVDIHTLSLLLVVSVVVVGVLLNEKDSPLLRCAIASFVA